jgi:hypothetical protein
LLRGTVLAWATNIFANGRLDCSRLDIMLPAQSEERDESNRSPSVIEPTTT